MRYLSSSAEEMIIPAKTAVLLGQASSFYRTAFGRIYAKEGESQFTWVVFFASGLILLASQQQTGNSSIVFFMGNFRRMQYGGTCDKFLLFAFLLLFFFLNQGAHSLFLAFLPEESWGLAAGILCTLRTNDTLF